MMTLHILALRVYGSLLIVILFRSQTAFLIVVARMLSTSRNAMIVHIGQNHDA